MMEVNINSVVTFKSGAKYLVLAATMMDEERYLYLTEVTSDEKDLKGDNKILKEVKQDSKTLLKPVEGVELEKATRKMEEIFSAV